MLKGTFNGLQQMAIRLRNIYFVLGNIFTKKAKRERKNIEQCPIRYRFDLNSGNVKVEIMTKEKSQSKITYQTDSLKG